MDSTLAIFGPRWRDVMADDPWGTLNLAKPPPSVSNAVGGVMAVSIWVWVCRWRRRGGKYLGVGVPLAASWR